VKSPLQHCAYTICSGHPPESEGARPGVIASPLGTHSVMGERLLFRRQDDQRKIGNSGHEASVPRCIAISQVPDSRRRFL